MLTSSVGGDVLARRWKRNIIDHLTGSSKKNKTICNEGEATELLISDSNQGVGSELSKEVAQRLSRSVVSLALCDGHKVLFACSGIAVDRVGTVIRFLTSASLARALNDKRKDHDNLKVEVRLEGDVVIGFLGEYDLYRNIAAVNVMTFPDVHFKLHKNHLWQFLPHSKVVALGRGTSGKLITTTGVLTGDSSEPEYGPELMLSTCKTSEVCEGGPLFDFDGNFAGMIRFSAMEGTFFLPARLALDWLEGFTPLEEIKFPVLLNFWKAVRIGERLRIEIPNSDQEICKDVLDEDQFGVLDSLGYPKPSILNDGMILVNTFEEPFGDVWGEGVWSELSETASSNIRRNIVALASFDGEERFFACSGFFIEWNGCTAILTSASLVRSYGDKIDENLRIEVLLSDQQCGDGVLPNKQRRKGTLLHYNLHYNVALVTVKDFHVSHPGKIQHLWDDHSCEVLSVGCCFKSARLMAARGRQISTVVRLDCKCVGYSTCKISKVGIGGPLLDFDGRFIGMNFYGKEIGTPFLLWTQILGVLELFKTKGAVATVGPTNPSHEPRWTLPGDQSTWLNRWPVPMPYWCDPDILDKPKLQIGPKGVLQELQIRPRAVDEDITP